MSKTWIVISLLALTGCGSVMDGYQPVTFSSNNNKDESGSRADYACLDNRVDYVLNTDVVDFEMIGGGGVKAGFTPTGIPLTSISFGVEYSQGQLQTMMHLVDPLKPDVPFVDVGGQAAARNIEFSADFTIALMNPDGLDFWYSTPISKVTENALTDNLTNLSTQLQSMDTTPWWTTVSRLYGSTGFIIPVGENAGVVVGDEFKVMDVTYEFEKGVPCGGDLMMPIVNSAQPKAIGVVKSVDIDYAYVVFEKQTAPINQYDYVAISTLVQPTPPKCENIFGCQAPQPRTQLGRSIRLGKLTSKPLPFNGPKGTTVTVDISPFVSDQLLKLIPNQQFGDFYLHR